MVTTDAATVLQLILVADCLGEDVIDNERMAYATFTQQLTKNSLQEIVWEGRSVDHYVKFCLILSEVLRHLRIFPAVLRYRPNGNLKS